MLNKRNGLIILLVAVMLNISCKKDFTTIGNNMIDKPLFKGKLYQDGLVRIYDQRVDKVMSTGSAGIAGSNLPVASLGIYEDEKFGTLTADIISDILPDPLKFKKPFGDNVKLLGAKLIIPYFSHTKTENDETIYLLDSIFGHNSFEIKVFEQTYLLPSFDPDTNLENRRHYYSDFDFNPFKSTMIADTTDFEISTLPYITYQREEDGTFKLDDDGQKIIKDSLGPHILIKMDTTFFRQKIFDHSGEDVLSNIDRFKDYFRGIYIEAISDDNEGLLMQLPFNQAEILVQYTEEQTDDNDTPDDDSDDTVKTIYKELHMKLGNTIVNRYNNNLSSYAQTALNNSDLVNGDEDIVLKGDAGSEAVIQLFNEQQLRDLRSNDWLINRAEIYFYVDKTATDEMLSQANRLFLYDYDNQNFLADLNAPENIPDNDYKEYNGKLETDKDGQTYYKFGITRHIRNVIKRDSTNVKLGLRVTNDVHIPLKIKDIFRDPDAYNPKGVILYGNQTTNISLKPVLKIYYSDPE